MAIYNSQGYCGRDSIGSVVSFQMQQRPCGLKAALGFQISAFSAWLCHQRDALYGANILHTF